MRDIKEIIEIQYSFAKSFEKMLLNNTLGKINDAYSRAYLVIEESIEASKCCDSRKKWKVEYKPTNVRDLKEEIIDIFKSTMNGIIDLSTKNIEQEEILGEIIEKVISKSFNLKTNSRNKKEITIKSLLKSVSKNYQEKGMIFPTDNFKVREENTLIIVRSIITEMSKLKQITLESAIKLNKQDLEKIKEDYLNKYLTVLKDTLFLWIIWTIKEGEEEEFELAEEEFNIFFNLKSNKNSEKQIQGININEKIEGFEISGE